MRELASLENAQRTLVTLRRAAAHVGSRSIGIVLLRVAAVLFCLQLAYLAIGNVVLRSGVIKTQVERAEGFHLDYSGAYTLWPGHVHLRDFSLRFEDYNVQFEIALESAELDVSLTELAFKKFHVTKLDAQDSRFRFRHKLIVVGDDAERVAAYPPIRGFADPPYYHGVRPPPIADEDYDLWEVRVEHVTARVSELWVMEHRFVGEGVARGSFVVRPSRWVQVEPAELLLERGRMTLGQHVVAEEVRGRIRCSVPDMQVQKSEGRQVLREISSSIRLELARGHLDFLQAYLARLGAASYSGQARWLIDTNVQRGVVQHGSHIELTAAPARMHYRGLQLEGDMSALLERNALLSPDRLRLTWQAPRLEASREQSREAAPFAEGLTGEQLLSAVQLHGEMALGASKLSVRRIEAPSLGWFDVPQTKLAGALHAGFSLQRSESGAMSGQARLELNGGRLTRPGFGAQADLTCALGATRASEVSSPWRFERLNLAASHAQLRNGQKQSELFAARLDGSGMLLTLSPQPSVQGNLKLHVSSTEALLPLVVGAATQDVGTALIDLGALDARARLQVEAGGIDVTGIDARDGQLRMRGNVSKRGKHPSGAVLVSAGPLNVGVSFERGTTDVSPLVGDDWLATAQRE
jgi:hypothetical protein